MNHVKLCLQYPEIGNGTRRENGAKRRPIRCQKIFRTDTAKKWDSPEKTGRMVTLLYIGRNIIRRLRPGNGRCNVSVVIQNKFVNPLSILYDFKQFSVYSPMPRRHRLAHIVSNVVEKNIDSSSKSNPLRRRGKNYDAST